VEFAVEYYRTVDGEAPIQEFLEALRATDPVLERLLAAGLKKLRNGSLHGPPFTKQVDKADDIFELRVGGANIARAFFFFRRGQKIVVTNGYVKKSRKVDAAELERARRYKRDWEARAS
jgi:phage-related protein